DAPIFAYPLLWSYGGMEVDKSGRVAINSKETRVAVEFCKEFWFAACDESGTAWDDVSNNRAFAAETISATLNAASIYLTARHDPEKAPPGFADKLGHFLNPAGPNGQYHTLATYSNCIMGYSKNKEACKEFIRFLMRKENYEAYITTQKGYGLGFSPDWEDHPLWKIDPALEPFRQIARLGRNFGFAGPYNHQASEAQLKYIIIDLFARVMKGESTESSIALAEQELKNIYERG
ncbi:MAG: extracellular solute-binding protein, partial [Nitrospira sp.]|nr:extracellular solute-binding protein [Nitrospira sp.]